MTDLEIKAAVRQRDGMRCVECGMTNQEHLAKYGKILDVHRNAPGSPYHAEDCVTLCRACHGTKQRSPRGLGPLFGIPKFGFHLEKELLDAFKAWRDTLDPKPDQSECMRMLVREGLKRLGFWPPKK